MTASYISSVQLTWIALRDCKPLNRRSQVRPKQIAWSRFTPEHVNEITLHAPCWARARHLETSAMATISTRGLEITDLVTGRCHGWFDRENAWHLDA